LAERFARQALAVDSLLADSHAAWGQVLANQLRLVDAEVEMKRARDLAPENVINRVNHANVLAALGRLDDGLEEVRGGRLYVSPGASQAIVDAASGPPTGTPSQLTPREKQVLTLVGEGKSTKQIAEALQISVKTAEFHRGRLMKKLNVHDTANLVRYAIREGWIAP
jgi:DNA-binding CsgD family transcriptional regulator